MAELEERYTYDENNVDRNVLSLEKISKNDTISELVRKCNENFRQIVMHGGGPEGIKGETGKDGATGKKGNSIYAFVYDGDEGDSEDMIQSFIVDKLLDEGIEYNHNDIVICDSVMYRLNVDIDENNIESLSLVRVCDLKGEKGDNGINGENADTSAFEVTELSDSGVYRLTMRNEFLLMLGKTNGVIDAPDKSLSFLKDKDGISWYSGSSVNASMYLNNTASNGLKICSKTPIRIKSSYTGTDTDTVVDISNGGGKSIGIKNNRISINNSTSGSGISLYDDRLDIKSSGDIKLAQSVGRERIILSNTGTYIKSSALNLNKTIYLTGETPETTDIRMESNTLDARLKQAIVLDSPVISLNGTAVVCANTESIDFKANSEGAYIFGRSAYQITRSGLSLRGIHKVSSSACVDTITSGIKLEGITYSDSCSGVYIFGSKRGVQDGNDDSIVIDARRTNSDTGDDGKMGSGYISIYSKNFTVGSCVKTTGPIVSNINGVPDVYTGVPIGTIMMWGGNMDNVPEHWALCDGDYFTISYTETKRTSESGYIGTVRVAGKLYYLYRDGRVGKLFEIFTRFKSGDTYSKWSGLTSRSPWGGIHESGERQLLFYLPDMRGRFPMGSSYEGTYNIKKHNAKPGKKYDGDKVSKAVATTTTGNNIKNEYVLYLSDIDKSESSDIIIAPRYLSVPYIIKYE